MEALQGIVLSQPFLKLIIKDARNIKMEQFRVFFCLVGFFFPFLKQDLIFRLLKSTQHFCNISF